MNSLSGTILLTLLLLLGFAPRRWALLAMIAGVFCLTQGHSIDVGGLNLYPVRFLEAVGFARVIVRGELKWARLTKVDWLLLSVYNYSALIWMLRSPEVTAQQLASAVDATLCYLALRGLISKIDDIRWSLNALVVVLIPYTALVFRERLIGQSQFTLIGAAPELLFRDGQPRAQGSFRHAILLGSVAASFLSLYIGLWLSRTRRAVALVGAALCLILVALSYSSGPMTSVAAVLLGWFAWPLRERLSLIRRGLVATLVVVAVFMKAPIWYLPFKLSELVIGGGGYHRGLLMERAWQDLGRWWLLGMNTQDTAPWFPYVLQIVGGADITNEFLSFGLRGGLLTMALFIITLTFAFKNIGTALRSLNLSVGKERADGFLVWALGVTLLCHIVSWFGVSYFDQSWVIWLVHFAAIAAVSEELIQRAHSNEMVAAANPGSIRGTRIRRKLERPFRPATDRIGIRTSNLHPVKRRSQV